MLGFLKKIFGRKKEKKNYSQIDFLIVGQGLSGSLLALELDKRGKKVCIVDDGRKYSASMVAAGVLNPVTGMRIVKTHGVDDLLPAAEKLYKELEARFQTNLFHRIPFYRYYTSEHEKEIKAKRFVQEEYNDWLSEDVPPQQLSEGRLADCLGGFFVRRTGWLEIPKLLDVVLKYFQEKGAFLNEIFFDDDVEISGSKIYWKNIEVTAGLIFCNGFKITENKWFKHLKWQPAKGEFIVVEVDNNLLPSSTDEQILKEKTVAVPLKNNRWKVGTTFEWENLNFEISPETGERLKNNFCKLFSPALPESAVRIVEHHAGVRPAIQGAKPMVGPHEQYKKIFLFNGFGAKGVTWIPLYAERFAESLCTK